jgi:hypothetical protein
MFCFKQQTFCPSSRQINCCKALKEFLVDWTNTSMYIIAVDHWTIPGLVDNWVKLHAWVSRGRDKIDIMQLIGLFGTD